MVSEDVLTTYCMCCMCFELYDLYVLYALCCMHCMYADKMLELSYCALWNMPSGHLDYISRLVMDTSKRT